LPVDVQCLYIDIRACLKVYYPVFVNCDIVMQSSPCASRPCCDCVSGSQEYPFAKLSL